MLIKTLKNFRKLLIYTLPLFIVSCEGGLIDNQDLIDRYIIVNGFISPQDTFIVNLSYMKNMWERGKDSVFNNADAYLRLPDNSLKKLSYEDHTGSAQAHREGFYRLSSLVDYLPGMYELTVNVPGRGIFTAKDSIPKTIPISYTSVKYDSVNHIFSFQVGFYDSPSAVNYYALSVNSIEYSTVWLSDRDSANGGYYSKYTYPVYNQHISSSNSFIEAPIIASLNQLVFSDKQLTSKEMTILTAELPDNFPNKFSDSAVLYIRLHSLSNSYYKYAITYFKQNQAEKDFYSEPVSVYSNINNGFGIFAGYSTSEKKITILQKRL